MQLRRNHLLLRFSQYNLPLFMRSALWQAVTSCWLHGEKRISYPFTQTADGLLIVFFPALLGSPEKRFCVCHKSLCLFEHHHALMKVRLHPEMRTTIQICKLQILTRLTVVSKLFLLHFHCVQNKR